MWPGSSLHYTKVPETPCRDDYDIEYYGPSKNNRWAYLGMGFTRELVEQTDLSPWLNNQSLDPAWLRAMGIDRVKLLEDGIEKLKRGDGGREKAGSK